MNTNTDFRKIQRRSGHSNSILNFFSAKASRPRLFLEVFVRKNLGKNYFNIGSVFSVAWRIALVPVLLHYVPKLWNYLFTPGVKRTYDSDFLRYYIERHSQTYTHDSWKSIGEFLQIYGGWYVVLIAFLVFAIIRWSETMGYRGKSGHLSTHMGDIHPFFLKLDFLGKPTDKNVSTVYEPLVFFAVGVLALAIGQNVGWLIIVSSIFYSLGNYADFKYAERAITDTQDSMIKNKALQQLFEGTGNNGNQHFPNGAAASGGGDRGMEPGQEDDEPTFAL